MEQGYIHIYTGNGKGKTTAALGLALRAAGAGKKVFIAQFVKGMQYSEIDIIKRSVPEIEVRQYGLECFIINEPSEEDILAARKGLNETEKIIQEGKHDLIILDEATIALYYKLFSHDELLKVTENKPHQTEIVITGRYAPEELVKKADLVTEMTEVKHYYEKGVQARKGIEY